MPAKFELLNSDGRVVFEATATSWCQIPSVSPLKNAVLTYSGDSFIETDPDKPEDGSFTVFQLNLGSEAEARMFKIRRDGRPTIMEVGTADGESLFPEAISDVYRLRATFLNE